MVKLADVEPHEPNHASEMAFVALCLILHANGGSLTVTKQQVEDFMQLKGHQVTQKFVNTDGSITFTMEDCPMHNCAAHGHDGH